LVISSSFKEAVVAQVSKDLRAYDVPKAVEELVSEEHPMAKAGLTRCRLRSPDNKWVCTRPPHDDGTPHVGHDGTGAAVGYWPDDRVHDARAVREQYPLWPDEKMQCRAEMPHREFVAYCNREAGHLGPHVAYYYMDGGPAWSGSKDTPAFQWSDEDHEASA
jgi:hypothetical protein